MSGDQTVGTFAEPAAAPQDEFEDLICTSDRLDLLCAVGD